MGPDDSVLGTIWAIRWMRLARDEVARHRSELNGLDRDIGDGDHGENLARGFDAVVEALDGLGTDARPTDVLKVAATRLVGTVGGAAGPLYGTALLQAATAVDGRAELDAATVAEMMRAAADGIARRGRATLGDKTMLDAWAPAADAAARALETGSDVADILVAAASAAAEGADATDPMIARKGRASYLGERAAGHRDPGAASTVLVLRAAAKAARPGDLGFQESEREHPGQERASEEEAVASETVAAPRVGLVLVSHSEKIVSGLIDVARQVAPDVPIAAAGGTGQAGIGTSAEKTATALQRVLESSEPHHGAVVLCDLGSAVLTARAVLDELVGPDAGLVRLVDAPLVEGAVAAAVTAQTGAGVDEVVRAAESARVSSGIGGEPAPAGYVRTVELVNDEGLHARPAAEFVKLAATFDARVTVNGKDARSLLAILSLGLVRGAEAQIASEDAAGHAAVDALADLVESGFRR